MCYLVGVLCNLRLLLFCRIRLRLRLIRRLLRCLMVGTRLVCRMKGAAGKRFALGVGLILDWLMRYGRHLRYILRSRRLQ